MTLDEITFLGNYTYSAVDLRAAIHALYQGALGPLDWVETRALSEGASAFREIHEGKVAAPKIVLRP
jgi:threonine dehydrogenase-like Zn-dependent dehydrogenase